MKWRKGEIIRLTVMVRPDNDEDERRRQGETGKIVAFFPEKEIITVQFKDRYRGVYVARDLVALQPIKRIYAALKAGVFLNAADCKILLIVYRLSLLGRYAKALKLAMTNPVTRFYCTWSCREVISRNNRRLISIH